MERPSVIDGHNDRFPIVKPGYFDFGSKRQCSVGCCELKFIVKLSTCRGFPVKLVGIIRCQTYFFHHLSTDEAG